MLLLLLTFAYLPIYLNHLYRLLTIQYKHNVKSCKYNANAIYATMCVKFKSEEPSGTIFQTFLIKGWLNLQLWNHGYKELTMRGS